MGSRDQLRVAHKLECSFVGPMDANFGQAVRHFHGPLATPAARLHQTLFEGQIIGIKSQAHDVNGFANEGN